MVSAGLVAIVGVGANLLHQIQLRRSADILLEQGKLRIEEGRPGAALSYLTRYAKLAPQNAEAQILLANTLADMGQAVPAIQWYERALLRDASRHEARRRLVELAIATHRLPVAKSHLLGFLLPYTPKDPQIYYLLGVCHEGLGEYGEAIQRLHEALDRDPALVDAYALLAGVLRDQRKNSEDADALMDQLITDNPKNAKAYIARSDYRAKYRLKGVVDDVREAVRIAPDDLEILIRGARKELDLAIETDDREELLAESEQLLQKGVALQPRFNGWYLGLAQVDRSRGDLDKAIAHIEEGLSAIPNEGDLQWNLADMMIQQDRVEAGMGIIARLRDQNYPRVPLEYLVALADARRKRFVDASERWQGIRGQMEPWPELARQTEYWLGVCYERSGEYGLQLAAFRNAVKIDPSWIPARQWLASALARTGRIDEAITEYQELVKLTGVPGAVYRDLARLLVLRELQRRDEQREWSRVVAFLDWAAKIDPAADDYTILRAEIQAAQQDRDAARATLTKGIQDDPDSVATRLALAALEQSSEQWDLADRTIAATQDKFGDTVEVRLARLRYVIQRYGAGSYEQLQELEQAPLHEDAEQQQLWRTSLAAAYYTLGRFSDAGRLWQQAVDEEPDNIRLRVFLFDLALADGDDARMKELLAGIRRIERSEDEPLWRYGEATRLVLQARKGDRAALSQAERLLEEVRAARQTWSRIPLLQAEIEELRGRYDKVVEQCLKAIDLGERSPTIIRRVVELLHRQRRYAEADSVLRRFEATQLPITGELGRLAADISFRVQDFSRALEISIQVVGDSAKYEDLVWMAQLHSVMGQTDLAEEKFRSAIKKQPKSPEAWIALVQHFARNGNPAKARLAIVALTKNIDKDSVVYVEAICLNALGDDAGAFSKFAEASQPSEADAAVLRAAAEFYLSHGLPARGEPLLSRVLTHTNGSESDITWARRNLAVIWATTGADAAKRKAVKLVEQNLQQNPSSVEDLRAKAICLDALGGSANVEAALSIIEELINTTRTAPADQLLAYQFCLKLDRRAEARRHLEQHTFENSGDPQNLVRYIRFVLENDELREAQLWIKRLQRICVDGSQLPNGATPADQQLQRLHRFYIVATGLQAQLTLKQGDVPAAIKQITQRVDRSDNPATTISSVEAAQLLASLAGELASVDESSAGELQSAAESLLRARAPGSLPDAIALVFFFVQHDRLSEAVSAWNAFFDLRAANEFAVAAAAIAAHPQLEYADLVEMTERVNDLPTEQRSKAVLMSLVQLLAFQDRHAEAIALQREILAKDPQNVSVMNNLACYLALSGDDSAEALELIESAIKIAGPVPTLLDSRGMVLLEMNRTEEALHDLEQAIEVSPNGVTYLHLAAAFKRANQDEKSEAAMAQARSVGLDPNMLHPLERARYGELLKQAAL